jgi:hypothetical protein
MIVQIVAACIAMAVLPLIGLSQEPIPAAKKQLIAELIEVMQVRQNTQKTTEAMLAQIATRFPQMLAATSASRQDLTPEQRERVKREAAQSFERFTSRFRQQVLAVYSSQDFLDKVYYPAYAKYYSEAELRDVIVFYKTPTGQKMLQVQPEFSADLMQRSFEVVGPKLQRMTQELVQEELERIKNQK